MNQLQIMHNHNGYLSLCRYVLLSRFSAQLKNNNCICNCDNCMLVRLKFHINLYVERLILNTTFMLLDNLRFLSTISASKSCLR